MDEDVGVLEQHVTQHYMYVCVCVCVCVCLCVCSYICVCHGVGAKVGWIKEYHGLTSMM